jgi:iron complex outermembrane receptor protein
MYGQAFRAPNFQELYSETSFSLPNPDLDPEESETWELALSFMPGETLRLGMNLYHYEQTDFISLQPVPGLSKLQYQNIGEYDVKGLELEAWWQPTEMFSLSANYAYSDPDDSPYRAYGLPTQQAYLRLDWRFLPDWNWNIQNNWIGEIERNPGDLRSDVDDYVLTDSTWRYAGIRDWEFALSVRNVFDQDARAATSSRIPNDLPLPGRSVHMEARYVLDGLFK